MSFEPLRAPADRPLARRDQPLVQNTATDSAAAKPAAVGPLFAAEAPRRLSLDLVCVSLDLRVRPRLRAGRRPNHGEYPALPGPSRRPPPRAGSASAPWGSTFWSKGHSGAEDDVGVGA